MSVAIAVTTPTESEQLGPSTTVKAFDTRDDLDLGETRPDQTRELWGKDWEGNRNSNRP